MQPARSPIEPTASVSQSDALALSLTTPQRSAIDMITTGHTLAQSASAAGVSRMTLYRWLKGDAAFIAAFNAWQNDVLDTARGRVLALSDQAVTTLAKSITEGDANLALKVLDKIGVLEKAVPGSTDAAEIQRQQALAHKKAAVAARKEHNKVDLDDALTI
jgi:AcrR family transcriptional regulator